MASLTSPMHAVAPPTKKMKAVGTGTGTGTGVETVEAVRKRREQLDRLKQKQQMRSKEKTAPGGTKIRPTSLVDQARSQLNGSRGPPPPPPGQPLGRARESDIFPGVEKVAPQSRPSRIPPPPSRPMAAPPVEPYVPRRLDQSFAQGKSQTVAQPSSRSKSAPPSRPPPPVPTPPPPKEAPASSTLSRTFAARPPPTTPGTKPSVPTPPPPLLSSDEAPPTPMSTPQAPPVQPSSMTPTTPAIPCPPKESTLAVPETPQTSVPVATDPQPSSSINDTISQTPVPAPFPATVSAPPTQESPSQQKPRQDLIQNLYQFAETPKASSKESTAQEKTAHESSLLRLEKEVREHEKAKAEALRKVVILEEQLQKLKEKGDPEEELNALVQLADQEGESAALQWARQKVSGGTPRASKSQVGFFSPLSPGLATPRNNKVRRKPTPHPKRENKDTGPENNEIEDKVFLAESVKFTPFEYSTDLATFLIRRPYGAATEREVWFRSGNLNSKQYEKNANVTNPQTLEVVAQIGSDGSTLALHGDSFVRHIGPDVDADWKEFGSVDELGKPLGSMTYIDGEANEKEYSLDDIFEGAVAVRENYCASVLSMAAGLRKKGILGDNMPASMPTFSEPAPTPKPQTTEIGVGTEDLPFPPPGPPAPQQQQQQAPPPPALEEEVAPDMVGSVFFAFAGFLAWVLRTFFITIPVKIVSFTLLSVIAFVVLSLISLQIAESSPVEFDKMFNQPGIV